ncbi:MAG: hypothetical protein IPP06_12845 [Saprospiraceae bacterium]|nr:hypothetical protein [Candidatus Vicinibacter affinis]
MKNSLIKQPCLFLSILFVFFFNGMLDAQNDCTFIPNISPVPGPNHNAISSMAGCEPIVFKVVPGWSGTPQGIGEVLIEIIRDVPFEVVDLGDFTKEEVFVNGILEKHCLKPNLIRQKFHGPINYWFCVICMVVRLVLLMSINV